MAQMKKRTFERDYVQVPNETAKAPELDNLDKPISLEALGLLVNLWSYDLTKWEVHKTQLYKRFAFNKERSVKRCWDELIEARYMIEFKYRKGKKWEYVYIFNILPYTEEQVEQILAESLEEYGEISGLQNADLTVKTSTGGPQDMGVNKYKSKQYKSKQYKSKKENQDDDEKGPFEGVNNFAFQEFVKEFEESFPNKFDNEMYNSIYEQMHIQGLAVITYHEAVEQIRYMQGRINSGKLQVGDYAAYFVGGIIKKRTSVKSALNKRKILKAEKEIAEQAQHENESTRPVPFYDWLNKKE